MFLRTETTYNIPRALQIFTDSAYPFPDGRVTAGTGCNAVGPRGGLPTQTSGLWLSDWTKRTLVLPKSLLWRPYAEALGPSKGRKTRLLEPFGRRFFGPLHKPGGVS